MKEQESCAYQPFLPFMIIYYAANTSMNNLNLFSSHEITTRLLKFLYGQNNSIKSNFFLYLWRAVHILITMNVQF